MSVVKYTSIPGNIFGAQKQFFARGGYINGLNPAVVGRIWYVTGEQPSPALNTGLVQGSDSNTGRAPTSAFATIARVFEFIDNFDIIVLSGVFREQVVAPDGVFDVTIMGGANRPRQATSGGVATGGGASWLAPASPVATTPLLELTRQGWVLSNIQMAPVASSACVRLTRSAVTDLIDASHAVFDNMYFVGGGALGIGIEDNGGCGGVLVTNSRFQALLDTAIKSLNTAAAVPLGWQIGNQNGGNRFQQNLNDIKMSLSYSAIENNKFMTAGSGSTNKVISDIFISGQGGNNSILLNQFSNTAAQIQISNGYSGASTDNWQNYSNNQAALAVGNPGA